MGKEGLFIVQIKTRVARITDMVRAVTGQTGDPDPFFCPPIQPGEPYDGHAHTFPPKGVTEPSAEPIEL